MVGHTVVDRNWAALVGAPAAARTVGQGLARALLVAVPAGRMSVEAGRWTYGDSYAGNG